MDFRQFYDIRITFSYHAGGSSGKGKVIVEDAGSGKSIIQSLRYEGFSLHTFKPDSDKLTRLIAVTDILESGFVYLPEKAPWLDDFLLELTRFPNAKHDDQVDALSQGLNWFKSSYRPRLLGTIPKPDFFYNM